LLFSTSNYGWGKFYFHSRVQVYDKYGNFKLSWFAPSPKQPEGTYLYVDQNNDIHFGKLLTYGDECLDSIYDPNGNLIRKDNITKECEIYDKLFEAKKISAQDSLKNTYSLTGRWFIPKIVKVDTNGHKSTIVTDLWSGRWLLYGPIHSLIYFIFILSLRSKIGALAKKIHNE